MVSFSFTDADLIANRTGKMTDAQKEKLRDKRQSFLIRYGVASLISFGIFNALIVPFDAHTLAALLNSIVMPAISGSLFSVFCFLLISRLRQIQQDIKESYVAIFEGPISLKSRNSRNPTYQLQAGRIYLNIPQKSIQVLKINKDHAVYYAPRSKIVLSIEEL